MAHEQAPDTGAAATGDTERRQLLGQFGRTSGAEALQGPYHRLRAIQLRRAGVSAEFALSRYPHHDGAREDAEHDLRNDDRDEVADTMSGLVFEDGAVNDVADDT